ncbi:LysM peptidoglycan-binding and 3D domain-containing protein [Bacillus sp. EB600]|uniref:LysM peptidoglycan-binding and 3D domain-containing protein n=1 Tax=Bacillus sp. EB600 TaxID=2806345 RepID=UPI00210AA037|nr:LysM peptidoglycan-binding and 3D domain-containing protein [Bacillus sp. EB600]MCQ6282293.1 LysM peptidoglycan-binding domain-containing protein [Bacillus sp. EB600]
MKRHVFSMLAAVTISGAIGASVQAQEVVVKKGDTLWKLSYIHNASIQNIKKWNHLSTDLIHPGDVLAIQTDKQYTVKQGDTLWKIALDNHVSVEALKEWNNLSTNLIHPGLNLVIYDNSATPSKIERAKHPDGNSTKAQVNTTAAAPQPSVSAQTNEKSSAPAHVKRVQQATPPKPVNNNTATPAPAPAAVQTNVSKEITVKATAYTASCEGCSGITRTGVNLKANPDAKVISVDPSVIPLGSKVFVEGYGEATAADTGGAIKGNRIDVYMPSESEALQFGAKEIRVKILN